jgi:dihydrofolate reductase
MRRVKLFIACSLDGYIARPDGGIDWLFSDGDYGYREFCDSIDTVIMGRKTWELSLGFGDYPYPGKDAYVFSRRSGHQPGPHRVQFVSEPVAGFVQALRAQPGRDLWLVGGGELTRAFLDEQLIDDFIISVHPRVLGAGLPLFPSPARETALRLVRTIPFESGLVQLHYQADRAG